MKILEELGDETGDVLEHAENYVKKQGESLKIQIAERMIVSVSDLAYLMAFGLFAMFITLFLCITVAVVLSEILDSWLWGFLLTTIAFAIIGIVGLKIGKEKIRKPVSEVIIRAFLD